ncbi:transaldolase [Corynebacterium aquilae]|uniref:Transaldolase n=1 Tax=Corynebacterium aquilae DSM 44791 TaxID=1431546 RepID=A0A1L7CG59_9CORY|nr:transaldolase [Corynebacterium aquilae]APT84806.1 transaldolase [Corynebacterium aquilae DSM 44791]
MTALHTLATIGTSTWLDDLSRDRINSGNLEKMINEVGILGVTTNPAIFAAAMGQGTAYDEQLASLSATGVSADEAVYTMAIDDVRAACDIFANTHAHTGGEDGFVSIEVDPRISDDAAATLTQARQLAERVGRDNVMIKIPATEGSLPAISDALAEGISVNVTLIFSEAQYRQVVAAYIDGINRAADAGIDVSTIRSVASVFVSRIDTEVDKRLEAIGTDEALALRGTAGLAGAQACYAAFKELFDQADLPEGAHLQRPLWASTGVKNPEYPDTMYVTELAGPNTVNTMPEATIDAVLDHAEFSGDTLTPATTQAREKLAALDAVGIDLADVYATVEREGVEKFVDSWTALLSELGDKLESHAQG